MATARLSPAASLLRNSRLFSLPPPLSPPASLVSDTATQPHPRLAAIETPASSWGRGDWGFKRPLPLKSTTKTGTTTIRVQNGIDSTDHIADFESAADHVLTLRKWRELNLPIRFVSKRTRDESMSVFEPTVDNISSSASSTRRRWRYDGPWLAGQAGWEFDAFLKRVKMRKSEFEAFVRARVSVERKTSQRQKSIDAGLDLNEGEPVGINDEEFKEYMHYLRATPSAFGPLIAEFFDLPEGPKGVSTAPAPDSFSYGRTTLAAEAYNEIGPPKTHLSAGLSYYRSGAHVCNHPLFGPQQLNSPVVARILRPSIKKYTGDVGVAGFVAANGTFFALMGVSHKLWQPIPGGQKVVARPVNAAVDSDGRVILSVARASPDSAKVYNLVREKPREAAPAVTRTRMQTMPLLDEKGYSQASKPSETQPFKDTLERMMRSNGDNDYI